MIDYADLPDKLQELADRADILDCMHRYARGMDRHDRELVRSAYHDDGIDDPVAFVGPADDFVDWAVAYHAGQVRHQHYLTNHTAHIDGDTAHAETYYLFVGTDRDPDKPLTITGGRYADRLERRNGRWGIVNRVCLVEWQTESISLLTSATTDFLATVQTVAQDRTDTSYDRPLTSRRVASTN